MGGGGLSARIKLSGGNLKRIYFTWEEIFMKGFPVRVFFLEGEQNLAFYF